MPTFWKILQSYLRTSAVDPQEKCDTYVAHLVLEALCEAPSSIQTCIFTLACVRGLRQGAADSIIQQMPVLTGRAAGPAGKGRAASGSGVLGAAAASAGSATVSARVGCACKAVCYLRCRGLCLACKCISCHHTCQHAHAAAPASNGNNLEPMGRGASGGPCRISSKTGRSTRGTRRHCPSSNSRRAANRAKMSFMLQ